jgi:hypothetical protein
MGLSAPTYATEDGDLPIIVVVLQHSDVFRSSFNDSLSQIHGF